MKKFFCFLLALLMIFNTLITAYSEDISQEKKYPIEITLPSDFYNEQITQETLNADCIAGNYISATLNADQTISYVLNQEQHERLLKETAELIEKGILDIINSGSYPSILKIEHNEDFSVFDVYLSTDTVDFMVSFTTINFYIFGALYDIVNVGNGIISVRFINEKTGKIIEEASQNLNAEGENAEISGNSNDEKEHLSDGDYAEIGNGVCYISTPGGTSENKSIPVIYNTNTFMMDIGLITNGFNGASLSYIYIDKILVDKKQLANTYASLLLNESQLTEGIHTVEVVQYENDNTSAAMTCYRVMQYQVKIA